MSSDKTVYLRSLLTTAVENLEKATGVAHELVRDRMMPEGLIALGGPIDDVRDALAILEKI